MKKTLILCICVVLATNLFAQEKRYSWGVKASYNLSSSIDVDKMKSGFNGGLFGEYRFNKLFALSPELLFSTQRFSLTGDPYSIDKRYNFINLPIMAKYYVFEKLSVDVGPQIGYLLSVNGGTYNRIDLSLGVGVTYNFSHFIASVRYNVSIINPDKSLNSTIQAGIGYRF